MTDLVLSHRAGAVLTLSLNRPDRLNALNEPLAAQLERALRDAAEDPECRAIVLRGEGRGFCAGQDLAEVEDGADLGALLERQYTSIVRLIRSMGKPVVASVGGVAAGAGANLALCCDIVLAAESARFIQAFVRVGLLPDVGGTWLLPRLLGAARARAAAMLGSTLTGREAETSGMIWRAVPDAQLAAETESLATTLAGLPTQAIGHMKRAFDAAETNDFAAQLELEGQLQRELGFSPDFREGRAAFLEKRPPVFTGRAS